MLADLVRTDRHLHRRVAADSELAEALKVLTRAHKGKADLFHRVASVVVPGGRFVVGDVVVPEDPADAVTPIDGEYDKPGSAAEQLRWLCEAGFRAHIAWVEADLAVLVGDLGRT